MMSHIGWVAPPSATLPPRRSLWRFFPWGVVVAMSVVVAVNGGLVYIALHSFPGKAGGDEGFALSNHYNAVLDQVQRESELGWTVQARTDASGRPEIDLLNRDGTPLHGAAIVASAERPLGAADERRLVFHEDAGGHYRADAALMPRGQWDLLVSASSDGHAIAATRRIVVR